MNTATAAIAARVTAATIRIWCRRGVITATKAAGRWIVDAASLARRIAIGAMRARKQAPVILSRSTSWQTPGQYTATGPAADLKAAFESGTPIALAGDFEGDQVYLGITRPTYGDYGIKNETIALERTFTDGTAAYVIDPKRLDGAPRLAALMRREESEVAAADARLAAQDDAYLNSPYN